MNKLSKAYLTIFLIFLVYNILRYITLSNVSVLEDHDGTLYLRTIEIFRTLDFSQIKNLSADTSLMFGFVGSLISALGWSIETSGRLVSFLSSIILFIAAYAIGKKFYSQNASIPGLVLMTLNPALIALSIAVLTEPLYVTIAYTGLLLFILYHKNLKLIPSFFIGVVFGLSFVTRLEGILFLFFIPVIQAVYLLLEKDFKVNIKKYIAWSVLFISGFLIIAGIKVSHASYNMGTFALDGRQVWTILIHEPGDRAHNEKLFGLDYESGKTNLVYLRQNPEALYTAAASDMKGLIIQYGKTVLINLDDLFNNRLPAMVGVMVMIFFPLGVIALYKKNKIYELWLIFTFILVGLTAPLLHNVVIRHILIIAPIVFIVAGMGIYTSFQYLLTDIKLQKIYRYGMVALLGLLTLSAWIIPLNSTLKVPAQNKEYDPGVVQNMAELIKNDHAHGLPGIAARKHYLAHYTNADAWSIPYTDYNGLIQYFHDNVIDYLLVEYTNARTFPFILDFIPQYDGSHFSLMYETVDRNGQRIALYRYISE